jgi:hypothetical protein
MSNNQAIIVKRRRAQTFFQTATSAGRSTPAHHLYQSVQQLGQMIVEVEELGRLRPEWLGRTTAIARLLRQAKKLLETQNRVIEMVVDRMDSSK